MFIIDMTSLESDFIEKNTVKSGANNIRTYDINHQLSLFAYYYEDYIHLKIRRYYGIEVTMEDWADIKSAGIIYPNIELSNVQDIYLDQEDNQLHIKLALVTSRGE